MPESPKPPEVGEELNRKLEELQKVDDDSFMKGYSDVTMDDLISKGYVVHTVEVAKGFKVKLRTLRKKEELDIKQRISTYDGANVFVMDQINADTLAYSVIEINSAPLPTEPTKDKDGKAISALDARKAIILDLADALCLSLIEEYRNLNKALVVLIKGSSKNSLARLLLGQESA